MYQSLHENRLKKWLTDRQIVRFRQKSARLGLERAQYFSKLPKVHQPVDTLSPGYLSHKTCR